MMAGAKRRALTADDLLRLQEEPPSKRARINEDLDATYAYETANSDAEEVDTGVESGASQSGSEDSSEQNSDSEDAASDVARPITADWDAGGRVTQSRISVVPRTTRVVTGNVSRPSASTFVSLGISSVLQDALAKMSIRVPTEVQTACIPPLLQGECRVIAPDREY